MWDLFFLIIVILMPSSKCSFNIELPHDLGYRALFQVFIGYSYIPLWINVQILDCFIINEVVIAMIKSSQIKTHIYVVGWFLAKVPKQFSGKRKIFSYWIWNNGASTQVFETNHKPKCTSKNDKTSRRKYEDISMTMEKARVFEEDIEIYIFFI